MTTTPEIIFNPVAYGRIKGGITAVATEIPLYPGDVQLFLQAWDSTKEFYATITNALNDIEVVKVTDIGRNKFTVERGQDDTTAQEWEDGAIINQRFNAAMVDSMIQKEAARQVAYNPNGILTPAYKFEKVFQSGPSDCEKRWFKNTSGTKWRLIAGAACPLLDEYFDDGYLVTPEIPLTFTFLANYDSPPFGGQGISMDSSFVYLAAVAGIAVYSISGQTLSVADYDLAYVLPITAMFNGITRFDDFLVASSTNRGLDTWSIDVSGNISHVDQENAVTGCNRLYNDGTFILVAYNNGLACYSINGSGVITLTDTDTTGTAVSGKAVHGDGTYLYMAKSEDGINSYTRDGSGVISYVSNVDHGDTYSAIFCKNGFIFACVAASTGRLEVFTSSLGVLTRIYSIEIGGLYLNDIYVDDNYIYITDYAELIHVFSYNELTGEPTFMSSESNENYPNGVTGIGSEEDALICVALASGSGAATYTWT